MTRNLTRKRVATRKPVHFFVGFLKFSRSEGRRRNEGPDGGPGLSSPRRNQQLEVTAEAESESRPETWSLC